MSSYAHGHARTAGTHDHAPGRGAAAFAPGKRTLVEQALGGASEAAARPSGGAAIPDDVRRELEASLGEGELGAEEAQPGALAERLGSFEEIVASAPAGRLPGDVRARFEAAHAVDLAAVRVHVVSSLAEHGVRGLSRGGQIALADGGDREALEHELGHVVDTTGAGGAPPNTSLDGMPLADDPAREARADELAAQARAAQPGQPAKPDARRAPSATPADAPLPKLTRRTQIGRFGGQFNWATHKTRVNPVYGGGFTAEGLGAVLSSTTKLSYAGNATHGQLDTLKMTVPPEHVDDTRAPLPEPPLHPGQHKGAYVVPAALLGAAIDGNLLYLPPAALGELATFQTQMVALAKCAPVAIEAKTTFGFDGLANRVQLQCQALDRVTGNPVATIAWDTPIELDRMKWGGAAVQKLAASGVPPVSAEWKTQIAWDAPHASGDGVRVVADKLGPDHPLGSTPNDATAANRVQALEAASTPKPTKKVKNPKPEPYIAGHLLNDHLGGPGNLSANLAPIPKKANSQMSTNIEKPAKDIVNDQRGWIRYEVRVTESHDAVANIDYPSRIAAEIEVYDPTGTKRDKNSAHIDIDSPSDYAQNQADDPEASRKLTGNARQTSPVMLDEVVLSHENDLRPNLRDSAELFDLIVGSELNPNIQNPKLGEAWTRILQALHTFELAALPELNLISTVSTAMNAWHGDPVSRKFLEDTKVGDVQRALDTSYGLAVTFVLKAKDELQRANAVVRKEIVPSDLFRNADLIRFADNLVEDAPAQISMLSLLESMQTTSVPFRVNERKKAKTSGNVPEEQQQTKFLTSYGSQQHPKLPSFQLSPVRTFEESSTSVHDLTSRAFYGVDFVSERAPKVVACLCELGVAKDYTGVQKLLGDPLLKTSDRCRTLLEQLSQALVDVMWNPQAIDMKGFGERHKITWTDSIEALGRKEPKVAQRLYELLGVS